MEPFFQADGKRIYFTGYSAGYKDEEIWYVDRLGNGWSNAVKLDSPINNDNVMYMTQAKNGDVFYDNISKRKMYTSSNKNGKFLEVQEEFLLEIMEIVSRSGTDFAFPSQTLYFGKDHPPSHERANEIEAIVGAMAELSTAKAEPKPTPKKTSTRKRK